MEKGIEFDYFDILSDEKIKAEFYELRTQFREYDEIVAEGVRNGIPCLYYNDQVVIGFRQDLIDKLLDIK